MELDYKKIGTRIAHRRRQLLLMLLILFVTYHDIVNLLNG